MWYTSWNHTSRDTIYYDILFPIHPDCCLLTCCSLGIVSKCTHKTRCQWARGHVEVLCLRCSAHKANYLLSFGTNPEPLNQCPTFTGWQSWFLKKSSRQRHSYFSKWNLLSDLAKVALQFLFIFVFRFLFVFSYIFREF